MGKYMRKGKGVGKMEVSHGTLVGVRTRARALAMEKEKAAGNLSLLHRSFTASANTVSSSKPSGSSSHAISTEPLYMELRNRRLEKDARSEKDKDIVETFDLSHTPAMELCRNGSSSRLFMPLSAELHSVDEERSRFWLQTGSCSIQGSDSTSQSRLPPRSCSTSLCRPGTPTGSSIHSPTVSIAPKKPLRILTRNRRSQELACRSGLDTGASTEMDATIASLRPVDQSSRRDMEVELCFGESQMVACVPGDEWECELIGGRRTRECTPDSSIQYGKAPGSATRRPPSSLHVRPLSTPASGGCSQAPSRSEIESFFSIVEQQERRRFINRFNFDPLLERPLRGRYEWFNM